MVKHSGKVRALLTWRVARVLTIGATAALAIVLGTAQVASAGITSVSTAATGSSAYATAAGTTYGPLGITLSVRACDTKADGHHAEAVLLVLDQYREDVKTVTAKAYGGNGTCTTVKATIACGYNYELNLWSYTKEGSAVLRSNWDFEEFVGC